MQCVAASCTVKVCSILPLNAQFYVAHETVQCNAASQSPGVTNVSLYVEADVAMLCQLTALKYDCKHHGHRKAECIAAAVSCLRGHINSNSEHFHTSYCQLLTAAIETFTEHCCSCAGLGALQSKQALMVDAVDAMTVQSYLRASGFTSDYSLQRSSTAIEQQWTYQPMSAAKQA